MFNSDLKEEALQDMKRAQKDYQDAYQKTSDTLVRLYEWKQRANVCLKETESLINSIAKTPKKLRAETEEIRMGRQKFTSEVMTLAKEQGLDEEILAKGGVGALAGGTVALAGPSVMMAAATTFGTASTGTAIASLSGAAASRAALAWLGGGALAAGGGGMAAGSAFLALAGPVGWGLTAISAGLTVWKLSSKNKEIARQAEAKTREIKEATFQMDKTGLKVRALQREVQGLTKSLQTLLRAAEPCRNGQFQKGVLGFLARKKGNVLTKEQKETLWLLVNTGQSLSAKINEKVMMD